MWFKRFVRKKTPPRQGPGPYEVSQALHQTLPFIFNSPHSGRHYPERLIRMSRLKPKDLRKSEDCFVDLLFDQAPSLGAPLIHATFPRAYIDLNREPYELDPLMFSDKLPPYAVKDSERVFAGFGAIPRVVGQDMDIYPKKLLFAREQSRIEGIHKPYHRRLKELVDKTRARFGWAAVIDCHSMPSNRSVSMLSLGRWVSSEEEGPARNPDFVLGDRYGGSCAGALTDWVEGTLKARGYTVARNNPYAGGYTTRHYGRPQFGVHALQIEINRRLYMNEKRLAIVPDAFEALKANLGRLIKSLARLDLSFERQAAAE
ncbi:MAG TPA: N-formylglutamate amidohydrolase [Sphingomonadales bacterium]|nr:N-formylglutamate amidohydrolase [Sphingomonadales bacterium]